MSTEKQPGRAFICTPLIYLGDLRVESSNGVAIIWFDSSAHMQVQTAEQARGLMAAGFAALRILDPDAAVIIRASNQALYALDEILPDSATAPPAHAFIRPGQVAPDRPAPDACVECGQPEAAHPAADVAQLVEKSSLGTPGARKLRDRADAGTVAAITARAGVELRPDDLVNCDVCHLTALRRELDPVMFATGIRWVCRDLAACSDRVTKAGVR